MSSLSSQRRAWLMPLLSLAKKQGSLGSAHLWVFRWKRLMRVRPDNWH